MIRIPSAVPGDSVAPADDRLFAPNALSSVWLIVGLAALVAGTVLAVWIVRPRHRRPVAADLPVTVHDVYLHRIDELGARLIGGELDERHLHHELARTLRSYVGDTGTEGADAMSATALGTAGRSGAAAAVRSFERPQFAESATSDSARSIRAARALVSDDRGRVSDDRGRVSDDRGDPEPSAT